MNVAGIDYSTHAVDIVTVAENTDEACWTRIDLVGEGAFERVRHIRQQMPKASWWDDQGVYLLCIERPFSTSRNDTVRLAEGAILACLPAQLECWEVTQQEWKPRLGISQREKPSVGDLRDFYPGLVLDGADGLVWPQDALDAAGMAFWGRDLNRALIEKALAL